MQTWYDSLRKPPLTPPKNVFGPVWAMLYLLIFIALFTYFTAPVKPQLTLTAILLVVHFTAGFSWTGIFFGRKRMLLALVDILVLDLTLLAAIPLIFRASATAALFLLPYLFWGLFATYLNLALWLLNRERREEGT